MGAVLKEIGKDHMPSHERELFETTIQSAAGDIFQHAPKIEPMYTQDQRKSITYAKL